METALGHNTSKVTYAVFGFALIIVLINLISVLFPSLILETILAPGSTDNPFQLGSWAIPVIITNLVALGLGIAYFKNKLPAIISKTFRFIYNFEVSKQVAIIVVIGILFFYAGSTMPEVQHDEIIQYGDYTHVKAVVDKFPEMAEGDFAPFSILVVKNALLKTSIILFDNIRVVPVLGSVAVLFFTYLLTYEITKKRFAGIISLVMLLQSFTFLKYDTASTYSNFWILFYLVSLYLIVKKKWYLSPLSYIASILSKPLTVAYLPMTLLFTYRANIPRKKKLQTLLAYIVVIAVGASIYFGAGLDFGGSIIRSISFESDDFWGAFTIWSYQLRFDSRFLLLILPLTVTLFMTARKVNPQADSILFLITGIMLAMPLLVAFSDFNLHPYRFVPLVVFFSIGVGTIFSKKIKPDDIQYT